MSDTLQRYLPITICIAFSVFVHIVLFVVFLIFPLIRVQAQPEPPESILMHVMRPPAPPAPMPEPPPPAPQPTATSVNPTEDVEPQVEVTQESEPEAEQPERPAAPEEEPQIENPPAPNVVADQETLDRMRRELERTMAQEKVKETEVLEQIAQMSDEAPGMKRDYTTIGTDRGTVRELNIEGYPEAMQQRFMARYGIKVRLKYVDASKNGSYINVARTDRGAYLNRGGRGYYEVLTLTDTVLKKMAQLEEAAMEERNLDPLRTEITLVVFGLTETPGGFVDLVITRFEAHPID
jgi:hypothetical protein